MPGMLLSLTGDRHSGPLKRQAAYRWAREIGADYLECDMQVSKDEVVLRLPLTAKRTRI